MLIGIDVLLGTAAGAAIARTRPMSCIPGDDDSDEQQNKPQNEQQNEQHSNSNSSDIIIVMDLDARQIAGQQHNGSRGMVGRWW